MYRLPEGLPARGEGSLTAPLSAGLSVGAENGSTPDPEAINTPKYN